MTTDEGRPVGRDIESIRADIRALRRALWQARDRLDLLDVATIEELRAAARDLRLILYRVNALERTQEAKLAMQQRVLIVIFTAVLVPIIAGAITVIQLSGG